MNDPWLPEPIERALADRALFRGKLRYDPTVDSTNTQALAGGERGDPEGSVYLADAQASGRGKPGRSWFSRAGEGIYVSLLLRPRVDPVRVPLLTLMTGVVVAESLTASLLEELGPGGRPALDIKWPNDILLNGRKLCGILSEMSLQSDRSLYAVVGIGLNVHQEEFPPPLDSWATSLFMETGRHIARVTLLAAILKSFETWYKQFLQLRFDAIIERWSELSSYASGRPVCVEKDGVLLSGVTRGLDASGALRLERANGSIEPILAGDVIG